MKTILNIDGMSCQHCVKHVTDALAELDGVTGVSVSLIEKTAEVEHGDGVTAEALAEAVADAGYDVV